MIQNAAAGHEMSPALPHNAPVLYDHQWIQAKQRIMYKILLTVYKALNKLTPVYITERLMKKPESSSSMCSEGKNLLLVVRTQTFHDGDRN